MSTPRDVRHDRATAPVGSRAIGVAAVIIMGGNLTTSLLGFVRQAVMAHTFGAGTIHTDAFVAASVVPQMFYDLTIGAAVSAALIPTITGFFERDGKEAVSRVSGAVMGLAWAVLAAVVMVLMLAADPLMSILLHAGGSRHPGELAESVTLVRILLPSLFFMGTSAVLLATLYSLRRFTVSAFATALFHLGIVAGAVFLARPLGVAALAVGAVVGAAAQALIQIPALLNAGVRPVIRLRLTPEVRSILRLYAPIAIGLLVSVGGQVIDLNFKAQLETGAITSMNFATTLTQFPIGIAVAALSFAILPGLSSAARLDRMQDYTATLTFGLRFVLFLTLPAAVIYLTLGVPIVRLLFQSGHSTPAETARTASALFGYAFQIPFVGMDQLLIFAFYARQNTTIPMVVGMVGVGIYVASALILSPALHVLGLALANTVQNSVHGIILLVLLILSIGTLRGHGVLRSLVVTAAAGAAMTMVALLASQLLLGLGSATLASRATQVFIPVVCAALAYVVVAMCLKSPELKLVWELRLLGRR